MQVVGTIVFVLLLASFFSLFGISLLGRCFRGFEFRSAPLRVAGGFFLGIASFLALWRVLETIVHSARYSFWASLFLLALGWWVYLRADFTQALSLFKKISLRRYILLGLLLVGITVFELMLWLHQIPTPEDPFNNFGSAHSTRYANIALSVYHTDNVPVLNQNFGQSLLTAAPMFLGLVRPFVALNVWLGISIFFLWILVYGLLRHFGLLSKIAALGSFLFMFGNTALSFTHVLSYDSNSPFAMSSYIDATCGTATFFLFLISLYLHVSGKGGRWILLVPAVLGIYWNFTGGQNVILAGVVVLLLFAQAMWQQKKLLNKPLVFGGVLFVSALLGVTQGGMLTPSFLRDPNTIPGTSLVVSQNKYTGLKPELPYAIGWAYYGQYYGTPYDPADKEMFVQILQRNSGFLSGDIVYKILWRLESNFWAALRVMFFPLLGFVLLFYLLQKKMRSEGAEEKQELEAFWKYGSVVFAVGFCITFLVIVSGRKWEMSRFMVQPYAVGMLFFVLSFFLLLENAQSRLKRKAILTAVAVLITIGPVVNAAGTINKNFPSREVLSRKLSVFVQNPGIVGQEVWQKWLESATGEPSIINPQNLNE